MHRAIEPRNIVWRVVNGTPVVKLISLGHAKLAKTIEEKERAFFESAHYSCGADVADLSLSPSPLRALSGGAMGTKISLDQKCSQFLAPEYRGDTPAEYDYAMDWFASSPPHPTPFKSTPQNAQQSNFITTADNFFHPQQPERSCKLSAAQTRASKHSSQTSRNDAPRLQSYGHHSFSPRDFVEDRKLFFEGLLHPLDDKDAEEWMIQKLKPFGENFLKELRTISQSPFLADGYDETSLVQSFFSN